MYIREKIELELRRSIDDQTFEAQVALLLVNIVGFRVRGADFSGIGAKAESQAVIEVVTSRNTSGKAGD